MLKTLTILTTLILASATAASELKATELQQYCSEKGKSYTQTDFDITLAQRCEGYLAAFFDSMIVIEKVTGEKEFCIPRSLPKAQTNLLLSTWIEKNREIAPKTTAAVALYATFKKSFPCSSKPGNKNQETGN